MLADDVALRAWWVRSRARPKAQFVREPELFCPADVARLEALLARLTPYLARAGVALAGGVAVEYHLARAGRPRLRERIADVDFVARDLDALPPAVTREFFVSHFHRRGPGGAKALVQLVDPIARLRIDIFPDLGNGVAAAEPATFGGTPVRVLRARSIVEHKLRTIGKASMLGPVDPKHVRDAAALADLCGVPISFATPHTATTELCRNVDTACHRCDRSASAEFPLAPKPEIFRVLGYV